MICILFYSYEHTNIYNTVVHIEKKYIHVTQTETDRPK